MTGRYRSLEDHLDPDVGPKRILSLDGGGVRGILTLAFLARLEQLLRSRHQDADLRLCDYFDLIGGTSTGAIIAAALAQGSTVNDLVERYRSLAGDVFQRKLWRRGIVRAKYTNRHLDDALRELFSETEDDPESGVVRGAPMQLRSKNLKTGLMIMAKRMDTGSPWPLSNNPRGRYFRRADGKLRAANGEFELWAVVRASTAAPMFFRPQRIVVAHAPGDRSTSGTFIDGGVTTANNPSLQLLQTALLQGFELCWRPGADELLLVSVGTGRRDPTLPDTLPQRISAVHASKALLALMEDCNDLVETIMQWLSSGPTHRRIDGEIGDLSGDLLGGAPLLTYRRYNVEFSPDFMRRQFGHDYAPRKLKKLARMDDPRTMADLWSIGEMAAAAQLQDDHLPASFDLV